MDASAGDRDLARLQSLLHAGHPCIVLRTLEEAHAFDLVRGAAPLSHRLVRWTATDGVCDAMVEHAAPIERTEPAAAALYHFARRLVQPSICVALDLIDHLGDATTRRALRDVIAHFRQSDHTLVLIDHSDALPDVIAHDATVLEIALPDAAELEALVRHTLKAQHRAEPIDVQIRRRDLEAIVRNLGGLTRVQAERIVTDCVIDDRRFDVEDLPMILAEKRRRIQHDGILEFVDAPTDLDDVGGLDALKRWLTDRASALDDDARAFGLPAPRGMLLLGVQGAGKSLCAKAVATAWKRPLLRLDPGALYDRFVGESERRLRQTLHQAELMAPIILWIDEIEKGFASAASHSVDGGLSQRMFGTLLTWMQEHDAPVFLVATANNIESLPPELLRKGRFDEIFFVDLPGAAARTKILEIHLRKRDHDPATFDLDALVAVSDGYSGAEIEQAIIAALHRAYALGSTLSTDSVTTALQASPPISVTMRERIDHLRRWARDRCVPAEARHDAAPGGSGVVG